MTPFDIAFHHATLHGVLTAVHLPDSGEPVPEPVLASLPREEADHARTLRGFRQPQFVGGRIALRRALDQIGYRAGAVLPDGRGAPQLPPQSRTERRFSNILLSRAESPSCWFRASVPVT